MAEEGNQNQDGELQDGEGRGGKLKPVLIALLALLVGGALGGGGAWFMLSGQASEKTAAQSGGQSGSDGSGSSTSAPPPAPSSGGKKEMYQIPGLVVNLARSDRTRYLKTSLQLELRGKSAAKRAEEMKPQLKDALLILLSNHSVEELKTMQGKYELKRQIVARLNSVLGEGMVLNTYFTEFVIQ
ncbi:flagellar basal body-associated FliL family protein [Thiohalorhabdus sp. Cl-TMA]|uniref:Flagellar protein FliL n=1 Tax=Thiohalorhabdus methylotrophus TaxID=3242694 RepID=A0ABV4TVZ6_9GAMM